MKAWVDELAKFKYPQETWDNLEFGLRKGDNPQVICTTTPRPITVLHQLDQKIIYPHYDFKHLIKKYFEIGMKLNDFSIQLVKYCN